LKRHIFILLFLSLLIAIAPAAVFRTGETVIIEKGDVIRGNLFAAGRTIQIKGTVYGDIVAVGGELILEGPVYGDLLLAGGDVILKMPRVSDVRAVGGELSLQSRVRGDVFIAGGKIDIKPATRIARDLIAYGGQVHVSGEIIGNAKINGGSVFVTEGTSIRGNLFSTSGKGGTRIAASAKIVGEKDVVRKNLQTQTIKKDFLGIIAVGKALGFLAKAVLALLLILMVPNYIKAVNTTMNAKPWSSIGIGILLLLLVPVLIFLCLASLIGIPIGLILLFVYMVSIYSTRIFVSIWLGTVIVAKFRKAADPDLILSLVVGTLVYSLLLKLPLIGWLIGFMGLLLGLGALLISKKDSWVLMKEKGIV